MDMEEKEVERILQNAADHILIPEYKEVYAAIEGQLGTPVRHRGIYLSRRWKTIIASACCGVLIGGAVMIPVVSHFKGIPGPKLYYTDELIVVQVRSINEFLYKLEEQEIDVVDFSSYNLVNKRLFETPEEHLIRGGYVEFYTGEIDISSFATISFYEENIVVDESRYNDYTEVYQVDNGSVKYQLKEEIEAEGATYYDYVSYAKYNNVTYIIDYLSPTNDITEFFDSLFH